MPGAQEIFRHSSLGKRQEQVLPTGHPGYKGWDTDHQSTLCVTILSEALKVCLACLRHTWASPLEVGWSDGLMDSYNGLLFS